VTPDRPPFEERARRLLRRRDVRFLLVGVGLLVVSMVAQVPAAARWREARLDRSYFVAGGDAERQEISRLSFGMYLPHRRWLYFASMGNGPLAADAVWIKSAGYVTREFDAKYKGLKFEWLRKLYETVYDLDDRWAKAAHVSAMILSAVRQDPEAAVEMLHKSMMRNPDVWYLPYQAGVTCLLWPGHASDAVGYFREAVRRPGHPAILEQIIPRLMSEAGQLEEAVRHARGRYFVGGPKALRVGVVRQLAEFVSVLLQRDLEEAVRRFRSERGRLPAELSELRAAGPYMIRFDVHYGEAVVLFEEGHARLMALYRAPVGNARTPPLAALAVRGFINRAVLEKKAPPPEARDAYDLPFLYDPKTGTVRSEGVALIEAQRTRAVIRGAIRHFARQFGRNPESLDELAKWVAADVARGKTIADDRSRRLGGGTVPVHPLAAWGARYMYDPTRGELVVPEEYRVVPTVRKVEELKAED